MLDNTNSSFSLNVNTLSPNYTTLGDNASVAGWYDPSGTLGYGIGRLLRGAFDQTWSAWQNFWNPKPSLDQITLKRKAMIYKKGLDECITHLNRALDNLRKNPNDPASLLRINKLVVHYQQYVNPAPTEELRLHQQKVFQGIEAKVEFASYPLREKLMQLLPLLSAKHFEKWKTKELPGELVADTASSPIKRAVMMDEFSASFDLNEIDGSNGFIILGAGPGFNYEFSVSAAGDINGDGIGDLVLGSPQVTLGDAEDSGVCYVIFGRENGDKFVSPFNLSLTNLDGTNDGFVIYGIPESGAKLGYSLSMSGDVNGDGVHDLVMGSPRANSGKGTVYVIFGIDKTKGEKFTSPFNLTNLNGTNGFVIYGVDYNGRLGTSVSTAADFNGDKANDLVLGSPGANSGKGTVYVIFGKDKTRGEKFTSLFNLNSIRLYPEKAEGFVIYGTDGENLGDSVAAVESINQNQNDPQEDTFSDLALFSHVTSNLPSGVSLGVGYVIFGNSATFPAAVNLNQCNTMTVPKVFRVTGMLKLPNGTLFNPMKLSINGVGDINDDKCPDLGVVVLVTDYYSNKIIGQSYVIFGCRKDSFDSDLDLVKLMDSEGFSFTSLQNQGASAIGPAGDINGDGVYDLVLSVFPDQTSGEVYVIFGSRSPYKFPKPTTNLKDFLNGTNGFSITGVKNNNYFGRVANGIGDINGDGVDDLVLGSTDGSDTKEIVFYVIFGKNTKPPTVNSNTLGIVLGVTFVGVIVVIILVGGVVNKYKLKSFCSNTANKNTGQKVNSSACCGSSEVNINDSIIIGYNYQESKDPTRIPEENSNQEKPHYVASLTESNLEITGMGKNARISNAISCPVLTFNVPKDMCKESDETIAKFFKIQKAQIESVKNLKVTKITAMGENAKIENAINCPIVAFGVNEIKFSVSKENIKLAKEKEQTSTIEGGYYSSPISQGQENGKIEMEDEQVPGVNQSLSTNIALM